MQNDGQTGQTQNLSFRRFDEQGFMEYDAWFADDELRRRIQAPTRQWHRYVFQTEGVYCWTVRDDGACIGVVQVDTATDGTGSVMVAVNPSLRHLGYGKRILQQLLAQPEIQMLHMLEAMVESDNEAAIRCCRAVHFEQVTVVPDEDGFLTFRYRWSPG